MAAPLRAARVLLLTAFVVGWLGSALGAPALLAFADHGHAHEVQLTEGDGHRDAILRHDASVESWHADAYPDERSGAEPPAHGDHTVHLPVLAPVVVARPAPVPALAVLVSLAWTDMPEAAVVVPRPVPSAPVPDGPLDALRTTVLLV